MTVRYDTTRRSSAQACNRVSTPESGLVVTNRWQFYEAPGGGSPVQKAIGKYRLTTAELARLYVVMDRVAEGRTRPGDVKALRDGVLEVRVRIGGRNFRLAYAELGDGLVLLGLHFFHKQRQVEDRHIDTAAARLKDWLSRHGA
ncbi:MULTISPECIES: type II toxin-antitoxin system RelE/ParE family toxin [unclassified Micromonospora]|uniref:type II toxin-antitoxin system RelE/ParE family toxin n=1 Tax=unclassified Micromonospora TaxID=2617518 RepID=UPI0024168A38|nr:MULTISPECIES: type II toxin-antitoxin system RelE/ParE family toxin [unclassified Micromonospora]MDG4815904.1 type II toxin-antitoxin system RelE/ParE family toxin [Micromonospora sp. WMMD956]WFE58442.1 type II toxin-antitoxin system RelE/ParE family toxin [Micromonospora sp. WMMD712]